MMLNVNNPESGQLTLEYKAYLYEAAKRGLTFLDVTQPGWRGSINVPNLNMQTCCIVTQLTGEYTEASLEQLGIKPVFVEEDREPNNEVDLGFYADPESLIAQHTIYDYLTEVWTELLLKEPR